MTNRSNSREVVLYTLPYCPDCRDLRRMLTERAVPFQEVDLVQSVGAIDAMLKVNGGRRSAPTVRIGRLVLVDPGPKELEDALKLHGYEGTKELRDKREASR